MWLAFTGTARLSLLKAAFQMSSLLHAFILLFDVVKDLFCSEPGGHLSEGRRLHTEVFLWGRAGGGEGGTSPPLRGGGRAVERVEVDSPFERGSAGHVLSTGPYPTGITLSQRLL